MPERSHSFEREGASYSTRNRDEDYWKSREAGDSRSYRSKYYTDRHRERERHRDRERYDRKYEAHRRSASPRNQGRDRSPRSRSRSPETRSPRSNTKPNFKPSGLLAAETNAVKASDGRTSVLKYNEPPEARKSSLVWRLYVFKDSEQVGARHFSFQGLVLKKAFRPSSHS